MRYTLDNFYQSKQWQQLMRIIKAERQDANGDNICEYCGEPIVKKYDCIGHHIVHLTEANVNDASISLNQDNVQLVHHRCHNIIHNKFGWRERQVYLVYGAPLAGKTTYVNEVKESGDLVVDMDNIWQCITGDERYIKPDRLKSVAFSVRDLLLEKVKQRQGRWNNAYVIGGYPLSGERERLIKSLGAREIFIDVSQEECLERLKNCAGANRGKEWKKYIEDWFDKYGTTPPPDTD